MNKTTLSLLLQFVVLVPLQAVFFNNLVLFNVAMPIVFIYVIISMPITMGPNKAMTIGFLLGMAVDIMSDTPGLNALCCTILAFIRNFVFHLYMPTDADLAEQSPSIRNMGVAAYLKYAGTMVTIYCAMVFCLEALQSWNPWLYLSRIVASSVFSLLIIYAIASWARNKNEKRL
ncbi:MAG: hypothetical protein K2M19_09515 [Muribaculaceae bacterium]|nr:hypothetical protein [Muribaculaceae bacterium]